MNRIEFIKRLSALGIGAAFAPNILSSCEERHELFPDIDVSFSGKILIIGAGAAGMTAGYILERYGIEYEIIEASSRYGGRLKKVDGFVDFPIDLGAEWIHTHPSILSKILSDPSIDGNIDIINYTPETFGFYTKEKLRDRDFISNFYGEWKFKNSTWFDFYERYVLPSVRDKIIFDSPVAQIDHSGNSVLVTTTENETFTGDCVIVTVPLSMLKNDSIDFLPELPQEKASAINKVSMPDGIKIFVEMESDFYPDITVDDDLITFLSRENEEKIIYDAAFRKDTNTNLLALFAVGSLATPYINQGADDEIAEFFMKELDKIFSGAASANYKQHIVQNWSTEPYIQGSYSFYIDGGTIDALARSINNKVYFAGEAYSQENNSTVHGAAETAWDVVREILQQ